MSKRLQVLLKSDEYKTFQVIAEEAGYKLGEWVRQILRKKVSEISLKSPQQKLASIRKYHQLTYPTGEIDQMIKEIESGYLDQ
jgi:hypothetical protein